jgi:thiol-disulfide isomerase/thioredoxin
VKKFYALALCTLSLAPHARAQQQPTPQQPATRPRRTQPATTQEQLAQPSQQSSQPSPNVPTPQSSSTPMLQPSPTPQPSPSPAAQTPSVPEEAHDYSPIRVQEFSFKNWTFKSASSNESISLREWARGKRLVLVEYFAPWCRNSKLEASVVAALYDKYHAEGFDVIAVSEYGTAEELKDYLAKHPAPSALVVESTSQDARAKTTHYANRTQAGDTRKWGTPFNVFLDASSLNPRGDTLAPKVWTASGELIPADAERFIRERLGLPSVAAAKD